MQAECLLTFRYTMSNFFWASYLLELLFEPEPRTAGMTGNPRHSTSRGLEDSYMILLCLDVSFPGDRTRVRVVHPVLAFADLFDKHDEAKQDILGFETGDDLRDRELFVFLLSHDRADMAREDKTVQFCLALLEQPFHCRGELPGGRRGWRSSPGAC